MSDRWDVSRVAVITMSGTELVELTDHGRVVLRSHRPQERTERISLFHADAAAVRHVDNDRQIKIVVYDHDHARRSDDELITEARTLI